MTYQSEVAADSPRGYWRLGGDGQDASGNGHHGTLVGGPVPVSGLVSGSLDKGLQFDGVAQRVTLPGGAPVFNTTGYTVEWLMLGDPSVPSLRVLYCEGSTSNNPGLRLSNGTDPGDTRKLRAQVRADDGTVPRSFFWSARDVFDGDVHHVALVDYGDATTGNLEWWVDGVLDASDSYTRSGKAFTMTGAAIAAEYRGGTYQKHCPVVLDEVATYPARLSSARIAAHAAAARASGDAKALRDVWVNGVLTTAARSAYVDGAWT